MSGAIPMPLSRRRRSAICRYRWGLWCSNELPHALLQRATARPAPERPDLLQFAPGCRQLGLAAGAADSFVPRAGAALRVDSAAGAPPAISASVAHMLVA